MANKKSRVDRFVTQSVLPIFSSVAAIAVSVLTIVGTNSTPALIPHRLAIPLIAVLAAILMATIVGVVGQHSRQVLSQADESAALRRIEAVLRRQQTSSAYTVFDDVGLDLDRRGQNPDATESTTVEIFMRQDGSQEFRTTVVTGGPGVGKSTLMARLAIKVANDTLSSRGSAVPLFVSALTWEPSAHLSRWVELEMQKTFRIRRKVTNLWMHSAQAILFVDGIDDLPLEAARALFLTELKQWQSKPSGGKLVVAFRDDNAGELAAAVDALEVDRFARIQPLEETSVRRLFAKILGQSDVFSEFSTDVRLKRQLDLLMNSEGGATPMSVRAIEKGSARLVESPELAEPGQERWVNEISQADAAFSSEQWETAVSKYLRVAELAQGEIAALALMRATLIQAGLGHEAEASTYFSRSLELFGDLNAYVRFGQAVDVLTSAELAVLRLLEESRPLILEEVFVRAGMTPSATAEVLNGLIRKGFASMHEVGSERIGFYESAVGRGRRTVEA